MGDTRKKCTIFLTKDFCPGSKGKEVASANELKGPDHHESLGEKGIRKLTMHTRKWRECIKNNTLVGKAPALEEARS